jgi:hypothetical protein
LRNQKPKSTFLDEIDDPHGDYSRAGAAGYERGPQYPSTMEDVRKHDAEVRGLLKDYTNPERVSSSSAPRQESSSSTPPKETNEGTHTCEHDVKSKTPRKNRKRKNNRESGKWPLAKGRPKA